MSERSAKRSIERQKGRQKLDARFFFMSMQTMSLKKRLSLAHRLLWRVELRAEAKRTGLSLRKFLKFHVKH